MNKTSELILFIFLFFTYKLRFLPSNPPFIAYILTKFSICFFNVHLKFGNRV